MKSSSIRPSDYRKPDYPIENWILERWSPRAMSGEPVEKEALMQLFEAARWAPSPGNLQNWQFYYALQPSPGFDLLFSLLDPGNQEWCIRAAALILAAGKTMTESGKPLVLHAFNVGLAVENLLLQGRAMGLLVHPMAGFNGERAKRELNLDENLQPMAMIAVGRFGEIENLSERNQAREIPSGRKPISEFVHELKAE